MSAGRHKLTYEDFVERARARHGDTYIYPPTGEYTGARTKVHIVCRTHGDFRQDASNHIAGSGCPKCGRLVPANATRELRKGRTVGERWTELPPFGALGDLYKLPFWN